MSNGRCRMHGGMTPNGLALPQTKTGRYSKYLPARLAARYQEASTDGELLHLREDIALLDARLADLLGRVDSGESGAIWRMLRKAFDALQIARLSGNTIGMRDALGEIELLIVKGLADYAAWADVQQVLDQRRRLVESERKRMVEMQQMITSERAMLLMGAVVGIIKEHVHDRSTLTAISNAIGSLIDLGDATRPAGD